MNDSIRSRVEELIVKVGLDQEGWSYVPTTDRRRLGVCNYRDRTIGISSLLAGCVSSEIVEETILHELAHAIAGEDAGHGESWKSTVVSIGGCPFSSYSFEGVLEIDPWRGFCRQGHEVSMAAAPRRVRSCSICSDSFSFENILSWSKDGEPKSPREIGGKYFSEYLQVCKAYS